MNGVSDSILAPALWQLNSQGKPQNKEILKKALEFLVQSPKWVNENQEEAKKFFSLLSSTHLTANGAKTYETLLNRHPQLFPSLAIVKTNVPDFEIKVPKERLSKLSPKLQAELEKQNPIELMTNEYHADAVRAFLDYLKTGAIHLPKSISPSQLVWSCEMMVVYRLIHNEDWLQFTFDKIKDNLKHLGLSMKQVEHWIENDPQVLVDVVKKVVSDSNFAPLDAACHLLYLAAEYEIEDLKWKCLKYIKENLGRITTPVTLDQLISLIKASFFINYKDLQEACLEYVESWRGCKPEGLPILLQISLDKKFVELTWQTLIYGLTYEENKLWNPEYKDPLDELKMKDSGFSEGVQQLIHLIKESRALSVKQNGGHAVKLQTFELDSSEPGKIYVNGFPGEKILLLNQLSQFIPLSLEIPDGFQQKDLPILKQLKNLKEVDINSYFLTTVDGVKNYLDLLSPTTCTALNLENVKDMTDQDLANLAEKLPNLKKLTVHSDKITKIPFKWLQSLDCSCCNVPAISLPHAKWVRCEPSTKVEVPFDCNVEHPRTRDYF